MKFDRIIKRLLEARRLPLDRVGERARMAARAAWVGRTSEALRRAQRQMDERCGEAVGKISEEAFNRLCDEEQAKVCAFLDPLRAAANEDRWPRHLYWGRI